MNLATYRRLLLSALLCLPVMLQAAPLAKGSTLPPITLEDQHGTPYILGPDTRLLVFTSEKATSAFVNEAFKGEQARLKAPQVIHVSDISAMPGVITRMFALPKLRDLPFTVALAYKETSVADLPRQAGAATVMRLQNGRVESIAYARNTQDLYPLLGLAR
ncbi:hypothetical protein LH462_04455 [Laribacter hongkongensis]|jgi:hypothetical protein|uniref:Uncharacterized protein n=1 Tax=Laribacter hongkongensis TaxID=168471 RepID=A0A248LI38_9NEIS|nr:FAD/FMN-containing dehydrogenase [Laribacter hongkongensis]ASJ24418.1 hypothetical protein LHGZ1_1587 [Laribacter hongkongensis]MCG9024319.1 hypothetical protein [Laribacter hongkongensis]MCG9040240.1 hypothetical protein [Laribacter hongkongensis]MCG9068360.1 hypothetical protein [Laribacter hongkongensis]MCG9075882.1 hypothetical protein [Laribacter hongkongensis]